MAWIEPWRVAKSLLKLKRQVDDAVPHRADGSDGGIGDENHKQRNSDHNPQIADGGMGIVTAFDITHDPASGVDTYRMAEHMRKVGDKRVKYIISNGRIWNPDISPNWRPYGGANPHDHHVHVSVRGQKKFFDDEKLWDLGSFQPDPGHEPALRKPVLRRGSKGPDVTYAQVLLGVEPADGKFGPQTKAAVLEFQREHKLVDDGVIGGATWKALLDHKGGGT